MINNLDIVVFDFETGGLDPNYNEAIQVAAKAYNARTLEPYPDGEFSSLMKPLHFDRLEAKALECNKKTVAELEKAPEQKTVWLAFCEWVNRFNKGDRGGRKTVWSAPIAGGKNIREFDMKFVDALNNLHHPKKDKAVLFSKRRQMDLEDDIFKWFENDPEPPSEGMDVLREYFGLTMEGAHDALVDVRQTGQLLMKFQNLYREMRRRRSSKNPENPFINFKGCFKKGAAA